LLKEKRIKTRSGVILVYQVEPERLVGFVRAETADGKVIENYQRRRGNKVPGLKVFDVKVPEEEAKKHCSDAQP
jgi:hypothetical protein